MKNIILIFIAAIFLSCSGDPAIKNFHVNGLLEPVEILRDQWGVNHIYARNQHDLFFAQGYAAARDRLFQLEMWRRQATGTMAEILGERELKRDIGTRLFMYRGDMKEEMGHYHEDGEEIISAFTAGVNAYIEEIMASSDQLPVEFKILGIGPQKWTPEVVVSRHQALSYNIGLELEIGRAVATLGVDKVKDLYWFHPQDPVLDLDASISGEQLSADILDLFAAYRRPVEFSQADILPEFKELFDVELLGVNYIDRLIYPDQSSSGSNNWVISGHLMEDGNTHMANDPHRVIAVPSLRYMAHLVAPGWNVIGGGEPAIPGISIGHNEYGAWGLTIFRTDAEDLYVYELNPGNLHQYKYQGDWEDMTLIHETIQVRDSGPVNVDLRYTRHGPVVYIDSSLMVAYAVRCGWLETGGAPYLASLRIDQTRNWEEFRSACEYFHIPGLNMVWADKEGNIGWQTVGIAPLRRNFSGMVPVPGDGRYEWDGFLPILQRPHVFNPEKGFFATANENVTPDDYTEWDAITYIWSDSFRGERINEVLGSGRKMNMEDMKSLQTDYLSLPARILVPMLMKAGFTSSAKEKEALARLSDWDFRLSPNSVEAAIYVAWEDAIKIEATDRFVPDAGKGLITAIQLEKIIQWLQRPDGRFGSNPDQGRDEFLRSTFAQSLHRLESKLGADMDYWKYGQEKYKHVFLQHPFSKALGDNIKTKLDMGPLPRGGNSYTVGTTGDSDRQARGASFRMIVNTGDWDQAVGTNTPGQSGDPNSRFYSNLFEPWAKDEYFPLYYSREKIESVAAEKVVIRPGGQ